MTAITVTQPTATTIKMVRAFDAPRALVWAAHTEPEHVKHWWGRGNPLDVTMDFRVGGGYRFVEHADGQEHAFRGEYREIVPGERIVQTFEYEPMPGQVCVETLTLTEEDGRTIVTTVSEFDSTEARDGMVQSGMEAGANESYTALDKYLAAIR
ncbi:SRPBCC family protein [Spirilliplanes yamanashiensis]|uniref:ATPase n=1 Tax=Spirilliplanes yamanashiensis TaxID=42233 RepID=A0A8J3YCM4_9ACTN|nr:SRPBCC family protein [Spirilliplanes yamanashiensis]MDP9818968.1 uncharacterized protein YndB with AHSA1/START domain [Spirilliplanes yamanashiensis]GIJ05422.1 ATPase [Spirilliplanes yamanashiensis]